jgi:hypothetical protein
MQVAGAGTTVKVSEDALEIDLTQSMIQSQITSTTIHLPTSFPATSEQGPFIPAEFLLSK